MNKSDTEWKKSLTPEQYSVLREKATEAPFTGDFLYNEEEGMYVCAACGIDLFASQHKFEAACGWPSFYDVANSDAVRLVEDNTQGMRRVEVLCKNCDGHLGHVFHDAPDQPTGVRFCINSVSLDFKADKKEAKNDSQNNA
jgi:peptide-methionine (R)-S-oxide reductase